MFAQISYPPIPITQVGPFSLSLHGLFAAFGVMGGFIYATSVMRKRGFNVEAYQSVLTWSLVGGIVGARWLTVPAQWAADGFDITQLFQLGNFSIMGGFAGGASVAAWRMRMVGLKVWPTLDASAFGMAIGTIVGRIGDLAIVEHLGGPTDFFLGYGIKPGYDVAPQHNVLECVEAVGHYCGVYHHTGLYDMFGAILLFGALYWIYNRSNWQLHYGQLFMVWLTWYGLQRFLIDFTRLALDEGGDKTLGPLTWSQWSGLGAALAGVALFVWFRRRNLEVTPEHDVTFGGATALV